MMMSDDMIAATDALQDLGAALEAGFPPITVGALDLYDMLDKELGMHLPNLAADHRAGIVDNLVRRVYRDALTRPDPQPEV